MPDLNAQQFGKYTIAAHPTKYRTVTASTASGKNVGYLMWSDHGTDKDLNRDVPAIDSVRVNKPQQRKGIASAMLEHARSIEPDLRHSVARTPEGKAWSEARP